MITDEIVVTSLTGTKWEWTNISGEDREGNLFLGSMGNASAVGTGIAIAFPHRRVVVLESDGSVLIDLNCLTVLGSYRPNNLTVIVFDNQLYSGSAISQPSATGIHTDLELMARGAGIEYSATVRDLDGFRQEAQGALKEPGLRYIIAKIVEDSRTRQLPKPTLDYVENKYRFMRYIEKSERTKILPTLR